MMQDGDHCHSSYGSNDADPTDLEPQKRRRSLMVVIAAVVVCATTVAYFGGRFTQEGLQDTAASQQAVHAQKVNAANSIGVREAEAAAARDFGVVTKETTEAEATMAKYGVRLAETVLYETPPGVAQGQGVPTFRNGEWQLMPPAHPVSWRPNYVPLSFTDVAACKRVVEQLVADPGLLHDAKLGFLKSYLTQGGFSVPPPPPPSPPPPPPPSHSVGAEDHPAAAAAMPATTAVEDAQTHNASCRTPAWPDPDDCFASSAEDCEQYYDTYGGGRVCRLEDGVCDGFDGEFTVCADRETMPATATAVSEKRQCGVSQMDPIGNLVRELAAMREAGLQPDVWTYNCLIFEFAKLGKGPRASAVLDTMREDAVQANGVTFNYVLMAWSLSTYGAAAAERKTQAMATFEQMLRSGFMPEETTWAWLGRVDGSQLASGLLHWASALCARISEATGGDTRYCGGRAQAAAAAAADAATAA